MHEWMTDSGLTPHIIVNAEVDGVQIPSGYASDGRIVLNISVQATQGLDIGNETVAFMARFGGVAKSVILPVAAVVGIYARETGEGLAFEEDDDGPPPQGPEPGGSHERRGDYSGEKEKRPNLRVVK